MSVFPPQVWVLTGITFCVMLGVGLVSPILPLYAQGFGVSYVAIGTFISVFPLVRFFANVPAGVLADRWGERRVATLGPAIIALGSLVNATASSYGMLISGRVLEGLGSALYVTTAMKYVIRVTPPQRMGKAMSLYQSSFLLGVSFGPSLGGWAASIGGLRMPFFLYGFLALVGSLGAWVFVRDPVEGVQPLDAAQQPAGDRPQTSRQSKGWRETIVELRALRPLFRDYAFVMALLFSAAIFSIRSGVRQTVLPLYAEKVAGLGTLEIGLLITGATVASLLLLWPAGRAVDRTRKGVAVLGNLLLALAVFAFAGANRFETLLAAAFGFGAITAFVGVVPAVVASDVIPPKMRGSAIGVYRMAGDLGFILGPLLGGLGMSRFGFGPTFSLFAVVALIAGLLALKMRETLASGKPKESAVTGLERME